MWYLYIARTRSGRFYTGITTDLERRFTEHRQGKGGRYTSCNKPLELLHVELFPDREKAGQREKQIKRWSRKKKKALIEGDFEQLRELSISRDHLP